MLKWFICTDGERILKEDCIKKCRLNKRCMPKPMLMVVAEEREWTGKISATQALNGARYNYLTITKDYAVNPKKQMHAIHGTMAHSLMEKFTSENGVSEVRFEDDISSGKPDYYEAEEKTLIDYKFPGSFVVKKTLGLTKTEVFSETEVYSRDTVRHKGKPNETRHEKGTPKVVEKWYVDPDKKDDFQYAMQLNRYRIFLESAGFPVEKMIVCLSPRDFNTRTAQQYGLTEPPYMHEIERIDDIIVLTFYKLAYEQLKTALETNVIPAPCNDREAWYGKRCSDYCPVREFCTDCPYKEQEEENE